nr:MAG TPA: hypothetical protein [Caudoviricetes sp.]
MSETTLSLTPQRPLQIWLTVGCDILILFANSVFVISRSEITFATLSLIVFNVYHLLDYILSGRQENVKKNYRLPII